ncbi:hypothetical protein [Pedobacter sp. UBA5917]|jgi:hypothetical protein|uniref:hypothetical protein n=1 Tax=Pedobacter sp. UBA5917 TaxID=1947061 RepID=UPI0025FB646A|nr:hypothetical protein [Pedobacter sp. UBA5917]
MIQEIKERIELFNSKVGKYKEISFEAATPHEIVQLKDYFKIPLPANLETLYYHFGGLTPYNHELFALSIDNPKSLLESLAHHNQWYRCRSMGLVDYIRFCWINDRPELDEGNYLSSEQINYLNSNYKCFGLYRTDWGYEEAYYLYFDRNGNFGTVRYHQDDISALINDYLIPLTNKSLANETLEPMLRRIIDQLEAGILAENE